MYFSRLSFRFLNTFARHVHPQRSKTPPLAQPWPPTQQHPLTGTACPPSASGTAEAGRDLLCGHVGCHSMFSRQLKTCSALGINKIVENRNQKLARKLKFWIHIYIYMFFLRQCLVDFSGLLVNSDYSSNNNPENFAPS